MIFVDKTLAKKPLSLRGRESEAAKELKKAKAYYRTAKIDEKSFPFTVYKNQDVVDTLDILFHYKCAYCETDYSASQPMAVEHYRPKGGVTGVPRHRGYWWLAADWGNLLPSCTDCNSHRSKLHYILVSGGQGQLQSIKTLSGKHNHFPLASGTPRSFSPNNKLNLEQPLLLNPCKDVPEHHLEWIFTKLQYPFMTPLDLRGETTINLCGLNRKRLLESRQKRLRDIDIKITLIRTLAGKVAMLKKAGRTIFEKLLSDEIASLDEYTKIEAEWSAMSRVYINLHLATLEAEFANLYPAKLDAT